MVDFENMELLDVKISRRAFLGGGAGMAFAFTLGVGSLGVAGNAQAQSSGRLNAYVSIAPDGTITIQSPVAEMGQGIMTGLPLIVAEELDADWSKVRVEQSPIDAAYHHPIFKAQYVVASISTLGYWTPMRVAGAQARRVLVDAAASKWGVPAGECFTEPSMVVHKPSGRRMSYGEIAASATVPASPPPIDPAKDLKPASTASSARACRAWTFRPRPTARRATASTRACQAWLTPPSCGARCAAADRLPRMPTP
jgi:isoquinoline 1-oxidoreductase beta subunit